MPASYRHTQPGWVLVVANSLTLLFLLFLYRQGAAPEWALALLVMLFLILLVVFSKLTVEIEDGRLRAYLGPGVRFKNIPLSEIDSVHVVRNAFLLGLGWGIRWTSHGVLYNVSGTRAVEIQLRNGKTFLLGSDEPEVLYRVLNEALAR